MNIAAEPTTIAVQDGPGLVRKIIKVVPHKDGGFSDHVPYHKAQSGWLLKILLDYDKLGEVSMPLSEATEYSADDRVKLMYHPSGFVQFSGEKPGKIISGLDAITGEPKGLGISTNPLSSPISTGPTFGVTAWGLADFEPLKGNPDDTVIFSSEEMYFRNRTGTQAGIVIEGFVFPARYWAGVRGDSRGMKLSRCVAGFEASGVVLEMKIIPLNGSQAFIAVLTSHVMVSFEAPSGFVLNGPSESKEGSKKDALYAIYPGTIGKDLRERAQNLTYKPPA